MTQEEIFGDEDPSGGSALRSKKKQSTPHLKKCNDLNGRDWLRFSISVWRDCGLEKELKEMEETSVWTDIKKDVEEKALRHPALFPAMLTERLLRCYTKGSGNVVLDPFCGSGSTLVAAARLGNKGIGFELNPSYKKLAEDRLTVGDLAQGHPDCQIHLHDSRQISELVARDSVDIAITSPPYWDILNQKRTADNKEIRNYGNYRDDLGSIHDYSEFLGELKRVWGQVFLVLKPNKYFIINVMDLRKGPDFYFYHADVVAGAKEVGFTLDDIIIWDRTSEYNNLRALGYPTVFRLNKTHEYLVILQKRVKASSSQP